MNRTKIESLQLLRVIAVSLVILIHAFYFGLPGLTPVNPVEGIYNLKSWGAIGVDLFFAISGFIMAIVIPAYARPNGWKSFITKRVLRIIPLYYLVSAYEVFKIIIINHWYVGGRALLKTLLFFPVFDKGIFQMPVIGIGWSLSYEMYFYLLVTAALLTGKHIFKTLLLLILILSVLGFFIDPSNPLLKFLLSPMLLEFALGILAGLAYKHYILNSKISIIGIKSVAVSFSLLGLLLMAITLFIKPAYNIHFQEAIENNNSMAVYRAIVWGLPSAMFLFGIIALEHAFNKRVNPIVVLAGDASYSCYLIHSYFVWLIAAIFKYLVFPPIVYIFSIVPVCLLLGVVFYWMIEKPVSNITSSLFTYSKYKIGDYKNLNAR
jgi:exopolysaccharide production protein ExoZ